MAVHAHLKNKFMKDKNHLNLMSWLNWYFEYDVTKTQLRG